MWMSLTKNPMKPIMQNPINVAMAIFWNSEKEQQELNKVKAIIDLYLQNECNHITWFITF